MFLVTLVSIGWAQQVCTTDVDCPDPQPDNMCVQRDCWDGMCMDVDAVSCDDLDGCTVDSCVTVFNEMLQQNVATCVNDRVPGCCWQASECPATQSPCTYMSCIIVDEMAGIGICMEVPEEGCCVSDEDCAGDVCEVGTCNVTTSTCDVPRPAKICPDDVNNACTIPICNVSTGDCAFITLDNETCPGACCMPGGECGEMDKLWCDMDNGTFYGINTFCQDFTCIATPSPTMSPTAPPTAPPTPPPTTPPTTTPTSPPTTPPTAPPTARPTASPTTNPTPSPTFTVIIPCCLPRIPRDMPNCQLLTPQSCVEAQGHISGSPGQLCDEITCPGSCTSPWDCLTGAQLGNLCIKTWCGPDGFCMADEKVNCPHPC